MNNILKTFCIGTVFACGISSCSSDIETINRESGDEVVFNASADLRATATKWDAGDRIGVYMKTTGTTLTGTALSGATANVSYTTTAGNGFFTATSNKLFFPHDGAKVDFVAYYPYNANISAGIYPVNIKDQTKEANIDLMYADNVKNVNASSSANVLNFKHQLARIKFTIKSTDGKDLTGLTATLNNMSTTANFKLATGEFANLSATTDVKMNVTGTGASVVATAFVIPNASLSGTKPLSVTLTMPNGKSQKFTLVSDLTLEKGKNYTYPINVKNASDTPDKPSVSYTHWMETPTITDAQLKATNLKYVTHYFTNGSKQVRNYSFLYDTDLKMAYWVAYPLCNYYTHKGVSRTDDWGYDPAFSTSEQPNMTKGIAGYDRGHQCPSADRLVCREANAQTFYFTNMTPQIGKLNQQVWANLEDQLRAWSSNIDTLYVVTGAMPSAVGSTSIKYTNDVSKKKICVPAYYFKALCRIDRESGIAYTIAFKFDNQAFNGTFMNAALSVAELEKMTGFTFFPGIDSKYKQSYDKAKWSTK